MAVIRQKRDVQGFDEVLLSGIGDLHLVQGNTESLEIEAEEQTLERLESEVIGRRLRLGVKGWLDNLLVHGPIDYYLTMKEIKSVRVSGAGNLDAGTLQSADLELEVSGTGRMVIQRLQGEELSMRVSGSGQAEIGGKVVSNDLHVSGSATLSMKDLETQKTRISVSGSCDATVQALDSLDVSISGAAKVKYLGAPHLTQHITGLGKVEPAE